MSLALSRALVATGAAAGLALFAAGTAAAHVTADAPGATQGGYAVVTFRVPTESATASTTKLTVALPQVASARTEPLPGWTAKVEKNDKNQFTSVTWTAAPGNPGITPEQFQRFAVSVGPLPKQDKISFPATQTYSDGKVVNWNEPMPAGGDEPEHPAPTVALAAGHDADDDHGAAGATSGESHSDQADSDNTARWLGGIGLVLGALGAALGLGSLIRGRRA
ncbi:YcnI family copper-binding membrane protein [Nocardia veterana]|uniref:YcnI family protein n=1 Tax=Nocardia veterana TaxID=132249 RepID=A0A7X6LVZ4_9NOCA|nr:YcnI family protein [Nocardia veterana]NKY85518.1 YcnI family protein [Nocardia veterana]